MSLTSATATTVQSHTPFEDAQAIYLQQAQAGGPTRDGDRLQHRAAVADSVEPTRVACSVLAAVVMNLFIVINHRPGRYAVL